MIQLRPTNHSDPRFYNPERDIGHLFPILVAKVLNKLDRLEFIKDKFPWIYSVFQNREVTVDDFVKIATGLGKYVMITLKDRSCSNPTEAMMKSGLYELPPVALVIMMAIIGSLIMDIFFVAFREKFGIGNKPTYLQDYLDIVLGERDNVR